MLNLRNIDVKNKKVLVRCDFNVPLDKNGQISDDFRIRKTIPTIKYLQERAETVILMSHLGDPEEIDPGFSFAPLVGRISEIIGAPIHFLSEAPGPKLKKTIDSIQQPGAIVLLENLRFNSGEKENNPKFVENLAMLGDIFVQEGFGVCHRAHASTYGLPQLLPACAGFLLEQELSILDKAMNNPVRPFVAILGGAKVSTKTKLIQKLLEKADNVLIGGKIANSILTVKGLCIKEKWSHEEDLLIGVIDTVELTSPRLHLPVDGLMALSDLSENYLRLGAVGTVRKEENIFDIGPETIEKFKDIIKEAKTIIWNGPLGYYENSYFRQGTKEILKAIAESQAYSIIGGGDTVDIVHQMRMENNFDYISTGGGAMLDYISGESLPGINVLKNNF